MNGIKLLLGISPFLALIPLSVLLLRIRSLDASLKWIGGYVLLCNLTGFISFGLWCLSRNNLWLFPVQTTLEVPLIGMALLTQVRKAAGFRYAFPLILLFVVFSICNSVWLQASSRYHSWSETLALLLVISLCIYYFSDLLQEKKIRRLQDEPMFWIASGILLYFAASLFLYGLSNMVSKESLEVKRKVWLFHAAFAGLHYVVISIGLWRNKAQ